MHKIKNFYILLILAIIIAGGSFAWQVIKVREITITPDATPLISDGFYEISTNEDPILGNPGAPLTLIMFSDFACADCQKKYSILADFVKAHPQEARMFLKYSPKPSLIFKSDNLAFRGALCANKQNKFWGYADLLIGMDNTNKQNDLEKNVANLKINSSAWQDCLNSPEIQQKIAGAIALSQTLGIEKVPTIYINNKKLNLDTNPNLEDLLSKLIAK